MTENSFVEENLVYLAQNKNSIIKLTNDALLDPEESIEHVTRIITFYVIEKAQNK